MNMQPVGCNQIQLNFVMEITLPSSVRGLVGMVIATRKFNSISVNKHEPINRQNKKDLPLTFCDIILLWQ